MTMVVIGGIAVGLSAASQIKWQVAAHASKDNSVGTSEDIQDRIRSRNSQRIVLGVTLSLAPGCASSINHSLPILDSLSAPSCARSGRV